MTERIINASLNLSEMTALEVALGYLYDCNIRDINKTKNPDKLRCHKHFNENLVSCIKKLNLEYVMEPAIERPE